MCIQTKWCVPAELERGTGVGYKYFNAYGGTLNGICTGSMLVPGEWAEAIETPLEIQDVKDEVFRRHRRGWRVQGYERYVSGFHLYRTEEGALASAWSKYSGMELWTVEWDGVTYRGGDGSAGRNGYYEHIEVLVSQRIRPLKRVLSHGVAVKPWPSPGAMTAGKSPWIA